MKKSPLQTLLLNNAQAHELAGVFRAAVGSHVRAAISYNDTYIQAQLFHGIDLEDVMTFIYGAPGDAKRPAHAAFIKTYQQFSTNKDKSTYSFGFHVTWSAPPAVDVDHNGKVNKMEPAGGKPHPQYDQSVREMKLTLSDYALFHRSIMDAQAENTAVSPPQPTKGKPALKLV